jgi:hypothetical protein
MVEDEKNEIEQPRAASLYSKLESDRHIFLFRAIECSKYTLPTLIPPFGHNKGTKYFTPYQSVGARGVNNLASKLMLALLPPNTPFFKLQIDDFTLQEMTKQEGMRAKVEEALNQIERAVQGEVEAKALRVTGFEALKHLIVGGNVLLYLPKEGGMRVFSLHRYVVSRDAMGEVLDIVVKEDVSPATLSEEVQKAIGMSSDQSDEATEDSNRAKSVSMYTHIYRDGDTWEVYQEINGKIIPGSKGNYPLDKSPWIPIRFIRVDGEDYGRGYVEEYLGDLKSLEGLTQSIVEGSAAAAKVLFLVNPNGTTSQKTLAEAANGAIVQGTEADVSTLQLNKSNDFRVAQETSLKLEERLSFAFMLNSAIQRSGERVTAEEIRYMAGELEAALGGIYSILSQEFQLPLVNRLMFAMERAKRLPTLPNGAVKPVIVTGMEALGRGNDFNKLMQFLQFAGQVAQLPAEINKSDALTRGGTALGIDMKGLVLSEEQLQQQQQQAMMMQLAQQGIGPAINAGGKLMQQGMQNGSSETSQPSAEGS